MLFHFAIHLSLQFERVPLKYSDRHIIQSESFGLSELLTNIFTRAGNTSLFFGYYNIYCCNNENRCLMLVFMDKESSKFVYKVLMSFHSSLIHFLSLISFVSLTLKFC
jgi:hypothetical protein